jgi:hypothetical protein
MMHAVPILSVVDLKVKTHDAWEEEHMITKSEIDLNTEPP